MILETYTQVNTNFFYSRKNIEFDEFNTLNKVSINPKKLNQNKFDSMLEYLIFNEGFITKVETNRGNFVFYGVTHDFEVEKLKERMKTYSQHSELFYFNCVDYFSYAFFCVANNGNVERLIRYNSEAADDEEVVYLCGKAHKWENTFAGGKFTKRKLEDCEQDFGYYELGLMVGYYLPFVKTDESEILNITVYSSNQHLAEIVKNLVKGKPQKYYGEISKQDEAEIFKMLLKNDVRITSNDFMLDSNGIKAYNYIISSTNLDVDISQMTMVSGSTLKTLNYNSLNKETFYELFVNIIRSCKEAKLKPFSEVRPLLKSLPLQDGHRLCQVLCEFNFVSKTYQLYFGTGRIYDADKGEYLDFGKKIFKVGTKFDHKTSDKIFKHINRFAKDYYRKNKKKN